MEIKANFLFFLKPINIDIIPQTCLSILSSLHNQPINNIYNNNYVPSCKIILFEKYEYGKIIEILCTISSCTLKDPNLNNHITQTYVDIPLLKFNIFGEFNNKWILHKKKIFDCFKNIINELKIGWNKSSNKENPSIFHKYNDSQYFLFIKKFNYHDSDKLIRYIGSLCNIKEIDTYSCSIEIIDDGICKKSDTIYLYIKYDKIIELDNIFNFGLLKLI